MINGEPTDAEYERFLEDWKERNYQSHHAPRFEKRGMALIRGCVWFVYQETKKE